MPVPMELSRIIISEINDQHIIYLREIDGERTFPILIGIFEATSIDRRVKGYPSPRPLTHDLIVNVVENLGGEFQDDPGRFGEIAPRRPCRQYARLRWKLVSSRSWTSPGLSTGYIGNWHSVNSGC